MVASEVEEHRRPVRHLVREVGCLMRCMRLIRPPGCRLIDPGTVTCEVLRTVVWLRQYPTQEALGFLFGVSDSTVLRAVRRCLPALEQAGKDTMRMPDLGPERRKRWQWAYYGCRCPCPESQTRAVA